MPGKPRPGGAPFDYVTPKPTRTGYMRIRTGWFGRLILEEQFRVYSADGGSEPSLEWRRLSSGRIVNLGVL